MRPTKTIDATTAELLTALRVLRLIKTIRRRELEEDDIDDDDFNTDVHLAMKEIVYSNDIDALDHSIELINDEYDKKRHQ